MTTLVRRLLTDAPKRRDGYVDHVVPHKTPQGEPLVCRELLFYDAPGKWPVRADENEEALPQLLNQMVETNEFLRNQLAERLHVHGLAGYQPRQLAGAGVEQHADQPASLGPQQYRRSTMRLLALLILAIAMAIAHRCLTARV
jgi:hypothetical protein